MSQSSQRGFALLHELERRAARQGRRRYRLRQFVEGPVCGTLFWVGLTWPLWGGALRLAVWLAEPGATP